MKPKLFLAVICMISTSIFSDVVKDTTHPTIFYDTATFKNGTPVITQIPSLIAFDLNDVVFLTNYNQGWQQTKDALKKAGLKRALWILASVPQTIFERAYLSYMRNNQARVWDGYLQLLIEKTNIPEHKEFLTSIRPFIQNTNILNEPIVSIIHKLQAQNHSIVALTNMGIYLVEAQRNILENKLETQNLSDADKKMISTVIDLLSHPGSTMPCPETKWAVKPQARMYEAFLTKNKPHQGYSIFVDDKEINVRAAVKNGIDIGLVFSTPEQFEAALLKLGLLPGQPTPLNKF